VSLSLSSFGGLVVKRQSDANRYYPKRIALRSLSGSKFLSIYKNKQKLRT